MFVLFSRVQPVVISAAQKSMKKFRSLSRWPCKKFRTMYNCLVTYWIVVFALCLVLPPPLDLGQEVRSGVPGVEGNCWGFMARAQKPASSSREAASAESQCSRWHSSSCLRIKRRFSAWFSPEVACSPVFVSVAAGSSITCNFWTGNNTSTILVFVERVLFFIALCLGSSKIFFMVSSVAKNIKYHMLCRKSLYSKLFCGEACPSTITQKKQSFWFLRSPERRKKKAWSSLRNWIGNSIVSLNACSS